MITDVSCSNSRLTTSPIQDELRYFDNGGNQWLTGVKHNYGFNSENWLVSGDFSIVFMMNDPSLGTANSDCYNSSSQIDPQMIYDNLLDGKIAGGRVLRFDRCPPYVVGVPESIFGSPNTAFAPINFLSN